MTKRTIIIFLLFSFFLTGIAQNYSNLVNYSINEGLFDNKVHCTFCDSRGYLWIGTNSGLFRYDAYTFKSYYYEKKDSSLVLRRAVYDIFEDSQNRLWFACADGLRLYQYETDNFKIYTPNNKKYSISAQHISSLTEDNDGNLWIGTYNGLNKFEPNTEKFYYYKVKGNKQGNYIYCSFKTDTGLFVGYSNKGSYFFCFSNKTFEKLKTNKFQSTIINNYFEDSKGNLWMCCNNFGFFKFDKISHTFIHYTDFLHPKNSLNNLCVHDIEEDENGILWIGTNLGINQYDYEKNEFNYITTNYIIPNGLYSDAILDLYKDKNGGIWISTWLGGVTYYHALNNRFKTIKNNFSEYNNLKSNHITHLINDKNNIWVGTSKGLYIFNSENNKIKQFNHSAINNKRITAVQFGNKIWVGTNSGLFSFSKDRELIKHYTINSNVNNILSNYIICLYLESDKYLWIGTRKGINILNLQTNIITDSLSDSNNTQLIKNGVKYFMLDSLVHDKKYIIH